MTEREATGLLQTSRGPVAYRATGHGSSQVLVLLHANPGDAGDFDAVVADLATAGRTVVRLDWPGYGASPALEPRGEAGALDYAEVLDEALTALQRVVPAAGGFVLVGNSVGGFAALRQALDRSDRVAGLVLVAPGGFTRFNPLTRRFARVMGSPRWARWLVGPLATLYTWRRTPTAHAALRRAYAVRRDPVRLAVQCAVWRSFLDPRHDLRGRAPGLQVPVLLTWGRGDPVLPLAADGRRAARLLPGARLVSFWCGHEPHAELPQAWLDAVLPFLDGLAADRAGGSTRRPQHAGEVPGGTAG